MCRSGKVFVIAENLVFSFHSIIQCLNSSNYIVNLPKEDELFNMI